MSLARGLSQERFRGGLAQEYMASDLPRDGSNEFSFPNFMAGGNICGTPEDSTCPTPGITHPALAQVQEAASPTRPYYE